MRTGVRNVSLAWFLGTVISIEYEAKETLVRGTQ